jgi:hypothetical protein
MLVVFDSNAAEQERFGIMPLKIVTIIFLLLSSIALIIVSHLSNSKFPTCPFQLGSKGIFQGISASTHITLSTNYYFYIHEN